MKCKLWAASAILFATTSALLLYGMLDTSVSYTYCADELERIGERQRVMQELLKSLSPHVTRAKLDTAAQRAGVEGAFDKGDERVVSGIGFVFDDAGQLKRIDFE